MSDLREQVEALPGWHFHDAVERQAVLDLIDAHDCRWARGYAYAKEKFRIDPDRLARAMWAQKEHDCDPEMTNCAAAIAAAYEEQE